MSEIYNNDDLLIRYLDGELSTKEKEALEKRLAADEALRNQLTSLRIAVQAVRHLGTTQQVASLHPEMMQELRGNKKATVLPMRRAVRYTMAAAACLLLVFAGIRLYQASTVSADKLYAEAFVDFTVSASRGSDSQPSAIETQYSRQAYEAVTSSVRSLQLSEKDSLLVGLSYLHTNQPTEAAGFFQSLAFGENEYRHDAEFYLALAYLKTKDYRRSMPLLKKIADNPLHLYHERVSKDMVEKVEALQTK